MSQTKQQLIVTREPLRLEEVVAEGTTQQNIIGTITIPPQKPSATQVIDSMGTVTVTTVTGRYLHIAGRSFGHPASKMLWTTIGRG